jgi:nucleotide-binding universal stress UspA family protein
MYADDPMLAAAAAAGYNDRLMTQQTMRELRRQLMWAGMSVDRDPQAAGVICAIGRPAREILKAARRLGSDLIVMGTQGRSGASRMFFGSTTEQVLRKTAVPVLAVPPGAERGLKAWPGARVLCALELTPRDKDDARSAAAIASALGASLTLLHVVSPSSGPPWLKGKLLAHDREQLKAARSRLDELARVARSASDALVESRTVLGNPAEEISATATDMRAGLIVLTLRPGHGMFGAKQGSITYRVLCGSTIPVLALQQRSRAARRT